MITISLWMKTLAWSLAFLLVAMAGLTPVAAQAVVPVNGTPPTLTPVTINDGAGDQNDPHVSGDWAAYTSDTSIRYYNFVTNTDAEIPIGPSEWDLLLDISGSKIVFSRIFAGVGTSVMVFDAATPAMAPIEIDAAPATNRLGSAIGGNTVAYIDFGLEVNGELVIHDLTTAASVRITNDTNPDQSPSVSPDGNVVTWEHCNTGMTNCDIWRAVRSGAVWTAAVISDSVYPEGNPDTNGPLVAYDSSRSGNSDIFWRPTTGGSEVQLQLTSFERDPSIAGNFIAFESRATLLVKADIYVYDMISNLLYRITETPLVTEQLTDIAILPNCDLRVVWASDEDGLGSRNIRSATFSLGGCGDTTPPVLEDPIANVVVTLPSNSNATSMTVTFPTPTATDDSNIVTVTTSPSSGTVFPVGITTVEVTATDGAGNTDWQLHRYCIA